MLLQNDFVIRQILPADLAQIMEIEHDAFDPAIWEKRETFIARAATFPQGFLVAVYQPENVIAGYICSERWHYSEQIDQNSFLLNHNIIDSHQAVGAELYISSLAVNSRFRSQRIGRLLFDAILDYAEKEPQIHSLLLLVNSEWIQAQKMYAQSGFTSIATFKDFFTNRVSGEKSAGIVMRKEIKKAALD